MTLDIMLPGVVAVLALVVCAVMRDLRERD